METLPMKGKVQKGGILKQNAEENRQQQEAGGNYIMTELQNLYLFQPVDLQNQVRWQWQGT